MPILKGLAWSVCFVVMVLVLAFTWGRIRGPSESQAEALKFFARDIKPTKGRNAFPAMWLSGYDVPASQVDAVYAPEREDIRRWLATVRYDGTNFPSFVSSATVKYSKLAWLSDEEKPLTCIPQNKDCLGSVRANRDQVAALPARHAVQLDHERAYGDYDFSWDDLPKDMFSPFRLYGTTNSLWLASAALDFADGNSAAALQQVCTNARAQRRMHAHSNTVLDTLFAMAGMENAASVFVQMLSELPLDQILPDNCSQAFAPVDVTDVDLKASMQSQFQPTEAILKQS